MKIECPVCHEEIPASQLNEIREFDCPHCHYRIEMEPFAASLTQLFPVAALILFILRYLGLLKFRRKVAEEKKL